MGLGFLVLVGFYGFLVGLGFLVLVGLDGFLVGFLVRLGLIRF